MRDFWWVILLVFFCLQNALSQEVDRVPVQFNQFFNAYTLINPASICSKSKIEVEVGTQRHSGSFKHIHTSFASANVRIQSKPSSKNFQVVGISLYSDREGEYLKRSRIYANYAWHTKLSSKVSLAGGISLGNFSYAINTPSFANSDNALDGSIGIFIYNSSSFLGFSINQLFNSRLTPIEQTDKLIRHYNLTGGFNYKVNSSITLSPKMLCRYAPGIPVSADISTVATIQKIVAVGGCYRFKERYTGLLGLERLDIGFGLLKAMFSYSIPSADRRVADLRTFELVLNYAFKPGKKKKQ